MDRQGHAQPVALPQNAVIGRMAFPRKRSDVLAVSFQTATQPLDVYEVDLRGMRTVRWTRSEVGGLDTAAFVDAELVRYPAGGGAGQMPAFLYKPRNASGKLPVVILWHGGPEGQSRPTFSPVVQLLASESGIAVLAPNVRGSSGYGKAYLAADDGVKREQALTDIGATLDWIGRQPGLDASRVGVYGGSYGGYMTLATVAFHGKRVRAAVDVVGISNLTTFLEHTQAYRRDLRRAEYGDEREASVRAVQEKISPLLSVKQIEAELFVQQGYNDPRVPRTEAEQIVKAVRARGKDVWYLLGMNEGHGFQKKENRARHRRHRPLLRAEAAQGSAGGLISAAHSAQVHRWKSSQAITSTLEAVSACVWPPPVPRSPEPTSGKGRFPSRKSRSSKRACGARRRSLSVTSCMLPSRVGWMSLPRLPKASCES